MSNATAIDVMRLALQQFAYKESPAGSNSTKYGKAYGMNRVPWCAEYVWWCGDKAKGANPIAKSASAADIQDLTVKNKGGSYVLKQTANNKKKKAALPDFKFGDNVSFNFSGGSSRAHTAFIVGTWGNDVYCIEGNTSATEKGSQSNGGCVAIRDRYYTNCVCVVRPKYAPSKFYEPKSAYGSAVPKLPKRGWFQYGDKGAAALQAALSWSNGYSLQRDGDFGSKTFAETVIFQIKYGLEPDGQFGEKCLSKLKEIIEKHKGGK